MNCCIKLMIIVGVTMRYFSKSKTNEQCFC